METLHPENRNRKVCGGLWSLSARKAAEPKVGSVTVLEATCVSCEKLHCFLCLWAHKEQSSHGLEFKRFNKHWKDPDSSHTTASCLHFLLTPTFLDWNVSSKTPKPPQAQKPQASLVTARPRTATMSPCLVPAALAKRPQCPREQRSPDTFILRAWSKPWRSRGNVPN